MAERTHSGHGFKYAGSGANDVFAALAGGDGQVHLWGNEGNDTILLNFAPQGVGDAEGATKHMTAQWWLGGHHVYGGRGSGSDGFDTFMFVNVHNVDGVTVGRFEDYDASRDRILIEGTELDLSLGQGTAGERGEYAWRVVAWDTDPTDSATAAQPWLVIDTNGGVIFYALEGVRVVEPGTGASNGAHQERHFIHYSTLPKDEDGRASEQVILDLPAVPYIDPVNHVPTGFAPAAGGKLINDYDDTLAEAQAVIRGSNLADVIAAGVNDDRVDALAGDDTVWGGSGSDQIGGGAGTDLLFGNTGNDSLYGESGADTLDGGTGDDLLDGGAGADSFVFADGFGRDIITGFDVNAESDVIDLSGVSAISDYADLVSNHLTQTAAGVAVISDGLGNQVTVYLEFSRCMGNPGLVEGDFVF